MKKLLLLISLFGISFFAKAQLENTPNWSIVATDTYKMGRMVVTDTEGNAVTVGDRASFVGDAYIYVRKFDVNGNLLWENMDSTTIAWNWHKPGWVCTDAQNNIYVAGYRYTGTSNYYTTNIIALKYAPDGTLIWKKVIDHTWPSLLPMRAALDSDNNFYIGTVGTSPGFTLIKLDNDGNVIFNVANASALNQSFNSMRIKNDMVVMTSYGGNGTTLSVVAFNTSGDFLWGHSIDSRGGADVEIDDDMNIYLLSRKENQVGVMSSYDIKIYKLNASGDIIDEFNYDFGNSIDFVERMTLVNNKISIIGQTITANAAYMHWLIMQIDLNGNMIWDAEYNYMASNDSAPYWITARENGDVYVSGKGGPAYIDFNGSQYLQYVTTKYSNGELIWRNVNPYQGYTGICNALDNDCGLYVLGETGMTVNHYTDECGINGVTTFNSAELSPLTIYPNPATQNAIITFNAGFDATTQITIYNSIGEVVESYNKSRLNLGINNVSISLATWSVGVYVVTLQNNYTSQSQLLIKQ